MKLIDAGKLLDSIDPVDNLDHLVNRINSGDFEPPKFSAEAVTKLFNIIEFLRDYENTPPVNRPDVVKLCDHIIEYLEQLRESK